MLHLSSIIVNFDDYYRIFTWSLTLRFMKIKRGIYKLTRTSRINNNNNKKKDSAMLKHILISLNPIVFSLNNIDFNSKKRGHLLCS